MLYKVVETATLEDYNQKGHNAWKDTHKKRIDHLDTL